MASFRLLQRALVAGRACRAPALSKVEFRTTGWRAGSTFEEFKQVRERMKEGGKHPPPNEEEPPGHWEEGSFHAAAESGSISQSGYTTGMNRASGLPHNLKSVPPEARLRGRAEPVGRGEETRGVSWAAAGGRAAEEAELGAEEERAEGADVVEGVRAATEVQFLGLRVRVRAYGKDTEGAYSMMEYVVPAGQGSYTHTHTWEQEAWFMLAGSLTWRKGDSIVKALPGDLLHMPVGVPHAFHNHTAKPARMLVVCSPAGLEDYFLQAGTVLKEGAVTKQEGHAVTNEETQRASSMGTMFGITYPSGFIKHGELNRNSA